MEAEGKSIGKNAAIPVCVCVITESASRVCENMVVIHKTVLGNVLKIYSGTSIEVQWLRLRTSTTGAQV